MLVWWLLGALLVTAWSADGSGTPAPLDDAPSPSAAASTPPDLGARILDTTGDTTRVHDPVLARDGDTYYLFSTGPGVPIRCSDDMLAWTTCGRVFSAYPAWLREAVPLLEGLWAPDISYHDGRWYLYYSASTFGSNHSVIGLATNTTLDPDDPDHVWVDQGAVITSQSIDDYNAIDPNLFVDADGSAWLAFGSFWSGIKLVAIDPTTGKPPVGAELQSIADNSPQPQDAIEGAFITRHGDFYYLFVSHDFCCRGIESTYNIRVGRSRDVEGPYVDRDGAPMIGGGGTLVYGGSDRWRGPGHNAVYVQDDASFMVYHAYDAAAAGTPTLRIEELIWDANGWPTSPSALAGV